MIDQTENYIKLKGISEKFNRVASTINDEDIKRIIISTLIEKINKVTFVSDLEIIILDYLDNNKEEIESIFKNALINKLK